LSKTIVLVLVIALMLHCRSQLYPFRREYFFEVTTSSTK